MFLISVGNVAFLLLHWPGITKYGNPILLLRKSDGKFYVEKLHFPFTLGTKFLVIQ